MIKNFTRWHIFLKDCSRRAACHKFHNGMKHGYDKIANQYALRCLNEALPSQEYTEDELYTIYFFI